MNAENENEEEKIPTWKVMYNPIIHTAMQNGVNIIQKMWYIQ